jgi:hypothetical protein
MALFLAPKPLEFWPWCKSGSGFSFWCGSGPGWKSPSQKNHLFKLFGNVLPHITFMKVPLHQIHPHSITRLRKINTHRTLEGGPVFPFCKCDPKFCCCCEMLIYILLCPSCGSRCILSVFFIYLATSRFWKLLMTAGSFLTKNSRWLSFVLNKKLMHF